jgi:DNA polymerase IV (DinB-like DNA polymerase)
MPLVLAGPKKVTATCAKATRQGIRVGLTPRQAAYLCPEAQILPADEAIMQRAIKAILRALAEFTDYAEEAPEAGEAHQSAVFYTDLGRLPTEEAVHLARRMGETVGPVSGLTALVGLANTRFVAYAAAVYADAHSVKSIQSSEAAAFLAPLPVALLPMKVETARRLAVLGLTTLGGLAALSPGAVLAQFGKAGLVLHQMAQGYDQRRVSYFSREKPLRATCEFETGVGARDMLESTLRGVLNRLVVRLAKQGSMARSIGLTLHLEGGATLTRRITLREPASRVSYLAGALLRTFGQLKIPAPVTGFELALEDLLPCAARQLPLLPDEDAPPQALQDALEALAARPNAPRCLRAVSVRPSARRLEQRYRFEAVQTA